MSAPLPSNLDADQCIRGAYDDTTGTLRTTASITAPLDINGEVLVDVRATDGDSVQIGDASGHVVGITDGALNVNVISENGGTVISEFNQITSVSSGITTTILTYTVPISNTLLLDKIDIGGSNIALFTININSVAQGIKRTFFGNLNETFDFDSLSISASSIIQVTVLHNRPFVGDFESRLVGTLVS